MQNAALRLWVLTCEPAGPARGSDRCRYVGALAVLHGPSTHVVFLQAPHLLGVHASIVQRDGFKLDLAKHEPRFATLDDALAWAERAKQRWMRGGWVEVQEPEDGGPTTVASTGAERDRRR